MNGGVIWYSNITIKDFNHLDDNYSSDYILLKLPFAAGMSPIAKATLRELALRAVIADTRNSAQYFTILHFLTRSYMLICTFG